MTRKAAFEIERRGEVIRIVSNQRLSPTREAFALRKGDPDTLNFFDNRIRENDASGWLVERRTYRFSGREWADQAAQ